MQTDVLIIGQGICGTFLSWWLEQAGVSFMVIDEQRPLTASKAAAGLINPVTGRRLVTTWMIDELLPFAQTAYRQIGDDLGISCMKQVGVVDFFPTAQMRLAFLKRCEEEASGGDVSYLQLALPADEHAWDKFFRYELGYGVISPCYLVDLPVLLAAGRKRLLERGLLRDQRWAPEELVFEGGPVVEGTRDYNIHYQDLQARRIIFCDGIESFANPYFSRLPFAPNKGEALIVEIPELEEIQTGGADREGYVFKKGLSLAPWKKGLYWVGSSYEWAFDNPDPTEAFRKKTEAVLQEWLKVPFRTVEHLASVRPATLERRPFVGFHPLYPAVGILNGMGTKGCSLAPYFAQQLVASLTKGTPIRPDADVRRFNGILRRE